MDTLWKYIPINYYAVLKLRYKCMDKWRPHPEASRSNGSIIWTSLHRFKTSHNVIFFGTWCKFHFFPDCKNVLILWLKNVPTCLQCRGLEAAPWNRQETRINILKTFLYQLYIFFFFSILWFLLSRFFFNIQYIA